MDIQELSLLTVQDDLNKPKIISSGKFFNDAINSIKFSVSKTLFKDVTLIYLFAQDKRWALMCWKKPTLKIHSDDFYLFQSQLLNFCQNSRYFFENSDEILLIAPSLSDKHFENIDRIGQLISSNSQSQTDYHNLINLEYLDLSKNKMSKVENVDFLVNLNNLSLPMNEINRIENLDVFNNLTSLDLLNNKILKTIGNFDKLVNFTTLSLSYNFIENIKGFSKLIALKKIEPC
ncbi:uncharacterized protein ASCRUDRAFT_10396 [Ascoidea rubescens DSM 1968]|uniref:L domain-like protein n=1 Tax=Ascoidea rubescens DSM 1968 TaxID=1344418 RepID=A0A1D2V9M6_9ASCO|nr:hypothetical protein ASCRUDRAFT_10396 [Ascoidea rubescens DSM 1968]ODV58366.1 hypothetical protein ASCRUDRAFT_10396 [Ascoidea rubescens DSM 1968]